MSPLDNGRKLVITGPNPAPFEIHMGRIVEKVDLQTTHEQADVINCAAGGLLGLCRI